MLDINTMVKRYFELSINQTKYEIEPCSLKTLKKFLSMKELQGEEAFEEYQRLIKRIIDKNKDNKEISMDTLSDLSIDQINYILAQYMEWMKEVKNSPNF